MRRVVDEGAQGVTALAKAHQGKAEQDGEQQNLQNLASGEGPDHRVGNDVQEEIDALLGLGLLGIVGHRLRIGPGTAETRARTHHVARDLMTGGFARHCLREADKPSGPDDRVRVEHCRRHALGFNFGCREGADRYRCRLAPDRRSGALGNSTS